MKYVYLHIYLQERVLDAVVKRSLDSIGVTSQLIQLVHSLKEAMPVKTIAWIDHFMGDRLLKYILFRGCSDVLPSAQGRVSFPTEL